MTEQARPGRERKCAEVGCDEPVGPRRRYCPACAERRRAEANVRHGKEWRARQRAKKGPSRPVRAAGLASETTGFWVPAARVVELKGLLWDLRTARDRLVARMGDGTPWAAEIEDGVAAVSAVVDMLGPLLPRAEPTRRVLSDRQ